MSRSVQRSRTQLEKTLLRSLTFVDMKGSALEQSLNVIHEFDKSQIGRFVACDLFFFVCWSLESVFLE